MAVPCDPVESERLHLAPYTDDDLEPLFAIHADPLVGRFTFSPRTPVEAARHYVLNEATRQTWGAAPWVARRREDAAVVGYGGLLIDADQPGWGVEVAYVVGAARVGPRSREGRIHRGALRGEPRTNTVRDLAARPGSPA